MKAKKSYGYSISNDEKVGFSAKAGFITSFRPMVPVNLCFFLSEVNYFFDINFSETVLGGLRSNLVRIIRKSFTKCLLYVLFIRQM